MSSTVYATAADITAIGRSLTAQQTEAAEVLCEQASAKLRQAARPRHDIDAMIADPVTGEDFALAVKSVVVAAVCRALDAAESSSNVSQASETLGAYTYSYSYANAGQNLYFLRNELQELGLKKQRFGVLEVF